MASQGGGVGLAKSDILKLLYGETTGGASPTTNGIGLQLDASLVNSGVN
jgi:hypothetical protein